MASDGIPLSLRKLYYWYKLRQHDHELPDEVRERCLRKVIRAAAETEFYDIEADAALSDVPILTDEGLRKLLHTEGAVDDQAVLPTGGTQGTRRYVKFSAEAYDWMSAYTLELYWQLGWRPGDQLMFVPRRADEHGLLGRLLMPSTAGDPEDPGQLRRQIETVEPSVIRSFPRILMAVARSDGELQHSPDGIVVTGQCLTPTMRQEIEEAFDTTVLNYFGLAETGRIAIDDGSGFEPCRVMVEVELPEGVGRPVVTSLINTQTPVLRYRVPDLVEADGNRLHRVLGRADDTIEHQDSRIYPADLIERLYRPSTVVGFTIDAIEDGNLSVRVHTRDESDPRPALKKAIDDLGLEIETKVVEDPLPVTSGGKKPVFSPE